MRSATAPNASASTAPAVDERALPTKNRYRRLSLGGISTNTALILLGVAFAIPLLWMLLASFDKNADAAIRLPDLSLVNYRSILNAARMRPFYNSLYLSVAATLITTIVALFAAYALSRRHLPFKNTLMLVILFLSGLPVAMLLVPTYQIFVKIHLINSLFYTSLFIAATSLPFAIWLLKNFVDQVPRELEEAAQIDGAGNVTTMLRVVVPLAMPGIVATGMITFIGAWGAFVIPLVLDSNPADTPGSVAIYQFMSQNAQVQFGPLSAYSLLFAIPVVAIYLVVSRKMAGAFTFAGGIKS
jgi:multiple sugar transport system permease protein